MSNAFVSRIVGNPEVNRDLPYKLSQCLLFDALPNLKFPGAATRK
jgi:hypothetical protein